MDYEKKLMRVVKKTVNKLGLSDIKLDFIVADDKRICFRKDEIPVIKKPDCLAEVTNADAKKGRFSVVIHRDSLKRDLEDTIMHELLHVLLWDCMGAVDEMIRLLPFDDNVIEEIETHLYDREHKLIDKLMEIL